jgi:hypothetical protein
MPTGPFDVWVVAWSALLIIDRARQPNIGDPFPSSLNCSANLGRDLVEITDSLIDTGYDPCSNYLLVFPISSICDVHIFGNEFPVNGMIH